MRFDLDPGGDDLYVQIASSIRRAIIEGEYGPGDRLPPARELADGLGVNFHTVRRAFATLVDDGVVDVRRGRGATVLAGADAVTLSILAVDYVNHARRLGSDIADIVGAVERALGEVPA